MQKLIRKLIVCLASLTLIFSGSVAAFHDLSEEDESYAEILQLHEMGIIGGIDGNFLGDKSLTFAEGIQMIVKGMDFSLPAYPNDDVPQAKDLFENVSEDAWYTDSLVIAAVNGLELSSDLDPDKVMTREAFTHHLFTALQRTGPYPFYREV